VHYGCGEASRNDEPTQNSCPVDKASSHSKEAIVETIRLRESYQSMVATMYFA
jgi:hypothetical protein